MISVQPQTKPWIRQLERASKEALPLARVATVNALARASLSGQRREIDKQFVLRNKFTEGSLRISLARVRSSGQAGNAIVGTISPYLALQERGGIRRPVRGRTVQVPTRRARANKWEQPIIRAYTLGPRVQFGKRRRGKDAVFVLGRGPRMRRAAVFARTTTGSLVKIRMLLPPFRLDATHWHTGPVRKYATHSLAAQVFVREAKKLLGQIK